MDERKGIYCSLLLSPAPFHPTGHPLLTLHTLQLSVTVADIEELSLAPADYPLQLNAQLTRAVCHPHHLADNSTHSLPTPHQSSRTGKSGMFFPLPNVVHGEPHDVVQVR